MYADKIETYLQNKLPEMLDMLANLVNRNTSSDYKPGVDEAGNFLAQEFEKIGFNIEILRNVKVGNSVIARKTGNNIKVLLICHIDSVFPEGTDYIKPFTINGNIAKGNGVLDMKACLVGCIYALKALKELRISNLPTITVFLSGDEEKGSEAVIPIIEREGRIADWALVTEGSRPGKAVVTQRKGNAYLKIVTRGRAAHAGNEPQVGRNAIVELANKIVTLQSLNDFEKGTTVTVTTISGGENRIVVPDYAEAHADIRFYTIEEWQRINDTIKERLSFSEIDGVSVEYQLTFNRPPLTRVPGSERLLQIVKEASTELNIPFLQVQPGGVSDGNFVSAIGTPTIDGLGPCGGMMCSPEEYLEIDSMVPCAARLALTIMKLGNSLK
ncbi:M20 family metallopeptidase [Cloacibacillus sp. An23]|uniref:M20 family metallopeptidase n=1 Tax=Cloacibacillus sp. An23 TaxID=1965591 RepID=UPI000B390FDF|nr:M20 family metallopeptidase [Cloacibacillus sp. An23]OUO93263.1 hypothetical protein B5F39_08155 [Cloacibacillus sp. An23]